MTCFYSDAIKNFVGGGWGGVDSLKILEHTVSDYLSCEHIFYALRIKQSACRQ